LAVDRLGNRVAFEQGQGSSSSSGISLHSKPPSFGSYQRIRLCFATMNSPACRPVRRSGQDATIATKPRKRTPERHGLGNRSSVAGVVSPRVVGLGATAAEGPEGEKKPSGIDHRRGG
jgi:hypothetical protein